MPYLYKCHLALQRRGHPVRLDRMSTFCFQSPPLDGAPTEWRYVAEPVCHPLEPQKQQNQTKKLIIVKNSTWWTFLTPVHLLLPCHSGALPQDNRFHSNELTPTCTVTLIQPCCHKSHYFNTFAINLMFLLYLWSWLFSVTNGNCKWKWIQKVVKASIRVLLELWPLPSHEEWSHSWLL